MRRFSELRLLLLVQRFLIVVILACFLPLPTQAFAYPLTDCAASRFGSDLNCTAADVSVTGIAIAPGGPTSCVGGGTISVDLDVTVNFAVPTRWDIGIFLATDGLDPATLPANGGSANCHVAVLPTTSPFLDDDPGPWAGVLDTCGDGNGTINGGTGTGVVRVSGVQVSCQAVDLSGGNLYIPFLTSWDTQSSPTGATCTSNLDPVPTTKSKCNSPDGTVLADVLLSTVNLVVLPTITKTDGLAVVTAGDATTYTVVITNTSGADLSSAIFQDQAVADLTIDTLSCTPSGGATCPASPLILAMQGGGITIPTMPVDSSVTFTLDGTVNATAPAGTLINTATVTVGTEINSASDSTTIISKLAVNKLFSPSSIGTGGSSLLSVTLQNDNLTDATAVAFTDTYPAGLVNTAVPGLTNSCGGTATAAADGNSLALSGGTISAGASCTVTVNVTSGIAGAYTNSTGPVTSLEFVGEPAFASLAVGASNLETSTKGWVDLNGGEPDPGDVIRYSITLIETAGVLASGVSVADTVAADLTSVTLVSCPAGATCSFTDPTVSATNITVAASSSVTVVFDATIAAGTTAGTTINNCASVINPGGIGASPCASTINVSPSAVAGSGNKPLYLYDSTSTPAYKLSRTKPAGVPGPAIIVKGGAQLWDLSPALASSVTISPAVTPLAIVPVNLYLASDVADESRTVQVDVACSGGGTTFSQTEIFDGTAVNNPFLPTTPTLVSFTQMTLAAELLCAAGETWSLTVQNITGGNGTRNVLVYPVSGGDYSYLSLPSLNVINVDSVNSYDAVYPAVTSPASGYFGGGQTVYVRAVVSDPFGSFDITSATVTIKNPNDTAVVTDAAMIEVFDSGGATKTYEYAYTIPASEPAGAWTTFVTAHEGSENTVSDTGNGFFDVAKPNLLILKSVQTFSDPINGTISPKPIPGSFMLYTILVTNTGLGEVDADTTVITDPIPANTEMFVGDINGVGSGSLLFSDGATVSGLNYSYISLNDPTDNLAFSDDGGVTYNKLDTVADANQCDATVSNFKVSLSGIFAASDGTSNPSFTLKFKVMVK